MKIHVLSDLHIEFAPFTPPATAADVVVLAGDTDVGIRGLSWAYDTFRDKRVVYVAGNHEQYSGTLQTHTERMRQYAADLGIHFLENNSLVIGDVAFLGATLWTDFGLFNDVPLAELAAEQQMMDYRVVKVAPRYRRLRARDTARLHKESLAWFREEIDRHKGKRIIVVSHHAPSLRSIAERYREDILSASFASDLDAFIEQSGIYLWIHGHVHESTSYQIGRTQIICNVRGYPRETGSGFDPGLVMDI